MIEYWSSHFGNFSMNGSWDMTLALNHYELLANIYCGHDKGTGVYPKFLIGGGQMTESDRSEPKIGKLWSLPL